MLTPSAIMWILLLIVMHAGTVRLSPVSVRVSRGQTAHILCDFGEGTVRNIYWKFKNSSTELKVVNVVGGRPTYFYDHYEGRADVDSGNKSTLILSAITVRDGGDYCCDVDRFQNTAVYGICTQLLVSGPSPVIPQCEPAGCQIEASFNTDINIRCELRKISRADDVTLEWYDERGELLNSTKDEMQDDVGDGFHTLVSTATVNVLEETHFSCNSSLTTPTDTERDGVVVLVVPTIAPGSTNSPTDDPGNKADANLPAIIIPVLLAVVIFAIVVLACILCKRKTRGSAATDHSRVAYTKAPTREETKEVKGEGNTMTPTREEINKVNRTEPTEAPVPSSTDVDHGSRAEAGGDTGGASGTGDNPRTETASRMTKSLLTDELLLALSKTVDITQVPPDEFSVHLGLGSVAGSARRVNANMAGNPQGAIFDLLKAYVDKHGTKPPIAKQLLEIFKTNAMMKSAEHLEEELTEALGPRPTDVDNDNRAEAELTEAPGPRPRDDDNDNDNRAEADRDTVGASSGTEGDSSTATAAGSSNMTSTEKVTDEQIEHLSTIVPVDKYYAFCLNINKTGLNKAEGILKSNQKVYKDAI